MSSKRKHSDEEDEEVTEEVENGLRSKRRAAIAASRDLAARKDADSEEEDLEEDDDEEDEDYQGDDGEGEDDEAEEPEEDDEEDDGDEDEEEDDKGGEEEEDEVDADAIKVECIEAELEEPTKDVAGYILKKAVEPKQRLEMWFSEEMSECVEDIGEAFYGHFEAKKIPVLQITKFDVIEETPGIYQIDVLEAKYEKAYDIREAGENDKESASENLSRDFYCLVKVDGIEKLWATRYFMPEED